MNPRLPVCCLFVSVFLTLPAQAQRQLSFDCSLDPLMDAPAIWDLTPSQLERRFPKPERMQENVLFTWLTEKRDRALFSRRPYSNVTVNLSLFGGEVPVEEAVADFADGKLNGITFSLYNRGDTGEISAAEFEKRFKLCGRELGRILEGRPVSREANPSQGLLADRWFWTTPKGRAALEHNPEALSGSPEFLRMRLVQRHPKGHLASAVDDRKAASARLSDLPDNLVRDEQKNVYIDGIPMVDQGPKGYCVVATAQRLFEYYGIPCDQHQLAQVAETSATSGTDPVTMANALGKIDYRFKTRFSVIGILATTGRLHETKRDLELDDKTVDLDDFEKEVQRHIDDGIPLLWSLQLGRFPEEPPLSKQTSGGHMRMIIGYNEASRRVIFSDSWGAGHEFKTMKLDDAFAATQGLFTLRPTIR